ncbi:quinone oxidoreductase-like isoform X2 [Rhopilema esculentum]|uniref:quinone oxidoreductase-like isoform X2 n=1 Tax=Rhopilema esculentum TaxID=499914 RepID=UPI0031DB067E
MKTLFHFHWQCSVEKYLKFVSFFILCFIRLEVTAGRNNCEVTKGSESFCTAITKMRAVRVSQFGGPEVLQVLKDVKVPTPAGKEVLIKVKAAGINPVDTYIRSGNYARKPFLPYTPGGDGAGIVHEVGSDVSKFKAGDRVWFYGSLSGSYAEYSLSSESKLFSLPDAVDFDRGAAIGVPYLTAYRALFHKCHAKAGETVLIHGASGGVGIAASQLAVAAGLRVLGTVGSAEGKQILKENHVHEVFNHRLEGYVDEIMAATSGNGVDIIIEMLANVNLGNDLKMLAKNGRVGVIGSRGVVEVNPRDAMAREASIHGVMLFNSSQNQLLRVQTKSERIVKAH